MSNAKQPLASFQRYQLAFTQHIRDPIQHASPTGVVKKRMAVYQEIVFNNLFQSVSACFPVAQQVLGKRAWLTLVRAFLREHAANSPFFREIPEEFLLFLNKDKHVETTKNPSFLWSLCHYEWMELAISTGTDAAKDAQRTIQPIENVEDLLNKTPAFIHPMQCLQYDYPVHQISKRFQPTEKTSTQLLIYRKPDFEVKFIALNAVTYRLISILQQEKKSGREALTRIAHELNPQETSAEYCQQIQVFGLTILEDLHQQGVITGVYSA
jgi:hypothetical protein